MEGEEASRLQASTWKRIVAYTWVAVAIAVFQLIWVFTSRYMERRKAEQQRQEELARKYQPYAGHGTAVRILQFYASPGMVHAGERSLVCYGVENASQVRIDPPIEKITPALSRCLEVRPQRTTEYQLSAESADGTKATQSVTVKVESR